MNILILVCLAIVATATIVTIYTISHCPDGFEDEAGFHKLNHSISRWNENVWPELPILKL